MSETGTNNAKKQRVWVIADLTSARGDWQQLGDGYRVEAHFILWQDEAVLQVPASALFRNADGWAVFAVAGGKARLTTVTTGHNNGLTAQIIFAGSAKDHVVAIVAADLIITVPAAEHIVVVAADQIVVSVAAVGSATYVCVIAEPIIAITAVEANVANSRAGE